MSSGNSNLQWSKKKKKDARTMKMKFNLTQMCVKFMISNSTLKLSYSNLRNIGCVHVKKKGDFF